VRLDCIALVTAVTLAACSGRKGEGHRAGSAAACAPSPAPEAWRHHVHGGRVASKMGPPHHAATDAIVSAAQPVVLRGKFAYGPTSKDAEDETVALWREEAPCRWREVARAITDGDGRTRFELPAGSLTGPGPHPFRMFLLGDLTSADASVWVVPAGTRAVLFDVDGTLTTDDGELFEDLLGGGAPDMQEGAHEVARRWAELGYLPIFITGRPYFLRSSTARWLVERKFPAGPLYTVDSVVDFAPTEGKVGAFKEAAIRALRDAGVDIAWAYGNASTDVCAYRRAGIAPDHTYIVGTEPRVCDDGAPTRPLPSYVLHLKELGDDLRAP